tara:strand:+ start:849 stop:1442 length:594 start_codon:yes stop_codon:yes gene_type:complete
MKRILLVFVVALGVNQLTRAQVVTTVACDLMNLSVNVSDTTLVKLYHPGHYLTSPGEHNIIAWEITDTQGNLIAEDTLTDESGFLFYHNIPFSDTMNVTAHLINDSAVYQGNPVNCLIEDQLYWEVSEVIPGVFTGRWEFVNDNVGVDQNSTLDIEELLPTIIADKRIYDVLGRELKEAPIGQIYIQNKKKYLKFKN